MSIGRHRLFVGLPIDLVTGTQIRDWAKTSYGTADYRLIDPGQMHVTVLFFGEVSTEKRAWMVDLMSQAEWNALSGVTDETVMLGRGALALKIVLPEGALDRLEDRLVPSLVVGAGLDYHTELRKAPLGQLTLAQSRAVSEPQQRAQRLHRSMTMHITFARLRSGQRGDVPLHPCSPLQIDLPTIALFQSQLAPGGSQYTILATGRTVDPS